MAETALPVEHLFSLHATLAQSIVIQDGPQGTRFIAPVNGGTFEGPKMRGTIAPQPGGDWVTVRADGTMKLDVRIVLQTDDGASILVQYYGTGSREAGVRSAPIFETGDERYAWLNNVLAVGIGTPGQGEVHYDVYRVL